MRYDTLDFNFLSVICMRVASRDAQLNCPAIDVVQRTAVVNGIKNTNHYGGREKLCNQKRKQNEMK